MKASLWFRCVAVLLLLFAAGHTVGFLRFRPPTPEARGVWEAMNDVRFDVAGGSFTYAGFYRGFGLFVSAYLIFAAFLAWYLARRAAGGADGLAPLAWGLFAVQVMTLVLCAVYFSAVPVVLSAVVALCSGAAAWRLRAASAPARLAA